MAADSHRWLTPGRSPRIGVVYPCSGTRDRDFWDLAPDGSSVHVTRVAFQSRGTVKDVMEMSSAEHLRAAARMLAPARPDVVTWADTSGSFLFGPDGDSAQVDILAHETGAPASTTSTALIAACKALGASTVDVASPYLSELNDELAHFLRDHEIGVGRLRSLEIESSYDIASVPDDDQRALIKDAAASGDAVLVPCTDFFSLGLVAELEHELGRPVVAANAATMWHVRELMGLPPASTWAGRIFALRSEAHAK